MNEDPMTSGWYYFKAGAPGGQQVGPLSWDALYSLTQTGTLTPSDLVWNAGLPQWLPANQIPGLAAAFPAMGYQQPWAAPGPRRPSWLWPVLIPLIALIVAGAGLGAYLGLTQGGDKTAAGDSAVATATTEAAIDLGKAEAQDGDPDLVVYTEEYGTGPGDQVLILMAEGQGRKQADAVAAQIGGTIVGEVEYIQLYQIQTAGTTAEDLVAAIQTAAAQPGVEAAFPNAIMSEGAAIEGEKCSPLRDPLYNGNNAIPYEMIGLQQAWDIIKASGVELNNVHLGIVDSVLNTKSGQGFGTELNFPDANGNYPAGQAKISGLDAKDTTDQPDATTESGLSHCTQATHVMVASADNGGVVGILGPAGDKVTMTQGTWQVAGGSVYPAPNPDPADITQYQGFFLSTLVELKKQVEAKATVINMSFGSTRPGPQQQLQAAAYKRFFEQMQKDHPDVVFVAAAGNEGGALDGNNYAPGGLNLPNVITVGALDQTGDRADAIDWYGQEGIEQSYNHELAAGTIPAETTLDQYTAEANKAAGSNYATGQGEVTLSACGTGVPTGLDADGRPVTSNGTSFAAPQVTAAIALIQSINSELNAEQIKEILVKTAAPGITTGDQSIPIPEGMGAGVLKVDEAVLRVINDMREEQKLSPFTMQQLLDISAVSLTAISNTDGYTITARIPAALGSSADIRIEVNGQHVLTGETTQTVPAGSEASWDISLGEDSVFVKVKRLDNGGCAYMTLEVAAVTGVYEASGTAAFLGWDASPIKDFQAKVELDGTSLKITFANDTNTVLTGTYDDATKTFVGTDVRMPDDIWSTTWWNAGDTTIVFDTNVTPVTALGRLFVPPHPGAGVDVVDIMGNTEVVFTMKKVAD